ncbi:hypothetical protein [Kitasatospora sp. NPDC088783]|uniref:hypothetical protein n=1 Tax=Kitasatospora sp. NPDC088783 TaxID=3364077 RepID=UPI00381787D4
MSTTFEADRPAVGPFAASCGCPAATAAAEPFLTWEEARYRAEAMGTGARGALPGCEMPDMCPDYPLRVLDVVMASAPAVNLHDATAREVFPALGLADGEGGSEDACELLGRVLLASALLPEDPGSEGAVEDRWHTGGRPAGRLQQVLAELAELALWCDARGYCVRWG